MVSRLSGIRCGRTHNYLPLLEVMFPGWIGSLPLVDCPSSELALRLSLPPVKSGRVMVKINDICKVRLATKERRNGRSERVTNLQLIEENIIFRFYLLLTPTIYLRLRTDRRDETGNKKRSRNSFPSVFYVAVPLLWFRTQFRGTCLNRQIVKWQRI